MSFQPSPLTKGEFIPFAEVGSTAQEVTWGSFATNPTSTSQIPTVPAGK